MTNPSSRRKKKRKPGAVVSRRSKARKRVAKGPRRNAPEPIVRTVAPPVEHVGGDGPARFPVVGIGASAGGLEALEIFFEEVEADSGLAYLLVTHQAPGRTSLLPELLARHAAIPVTVAENGMKIAPNHVYVCPPGAWLGLRDEVLVVDPIAPTHRLLPVDHLFRGLARSEGENAIAVVLSGNGSDGSLGIPEIKEASGMVMAQDPQSARYTGMPNSAIATHLVDYVLPPKEMPSQIVSYVRRTARVRVPEPLPEEAEAEVNGWRRALMLLQTRTGNDFTGYKKSTLRRRVERRMNVHGLRSVREYVELLERTPFEVHALFRELLISVTSFFRDPEAFKALELELARTIQLKGADAPVRIWIAGCATGEEAYSIAILVKEILLRTGKDLPVQIFATDLDAQAVETARAGKYPEGIAADVSQARLDRFFVKEESGYRVGKEIRELLVFAGQNIVKDPPFTKLDLVTCRNLLIYLEPELQKRVLWLFSYALRPEGLLLLGTSESVAGFDDVFVMADRKWKLFRRLDSGANRFPDIQGDLPSAVTHGTISPGPRQGPRAALGTASIAERLLLTSFVPPSVIMSERGDLIFVHGRTGPFLEPAQGEPTNNVFIMAREGLRLELPAAVRQASVTDKGIVRRGLQVKTNGGFTAVCLTVRKLTEPEALRGAFIATFEREPDEPKKKPRGPSANKGQVDRTALLENELQRTRENLQGTIEELETSNEELKSTNEELQSTNEELQSANEELETSREEMQSLNEELQTVNAELEERNRALSQTNDDMQNLLNSTDVATIFLDDKLAIKRFTTQAKKVFSLIDTDIGRPISDLAANIRYDDLVDEAREVLRTLVFREREIQTKAGSWRLMRVMPYRTHENLIDGLVITFVDIDRVKRAEEESRFARIYAENIVESVREALVVCDGEMKVISANRVFYDSFRITPKLAVGESLKELGNGLLDQPALLEPLRRMFDGGGSINEVDVEVDLPQLGHRRLSISARRMPIEVDKPPLVLLAFGGSVPE